LVKLCDNHFNAYANFADLLTLPGFSKDPSACIQLLTRVFENIANLVDQNSTVYADNYGKGHLLRLIQRLYEESLRHGVSLLETWIDKRRVKQTVH
jgi:hypothetical protein